MTRGTVLGALIAVGALSIAVAGQQARPRATLPEAMKVKDNLYMIDASSPTPQSEFTGGNVAFFVTDAGVILVDTKLAGYGPDIIARIKAVTNKPITTIINTHTHGDHTGSNEAFPATVDFVAQENTKVLMAKMAAFKDDKAQFLPKRTFKDSMTIGTGKDRVELHYFGAGHTGGDAWVVYPSLRVLQTGDMFAWKDAPLLDRANGGSGLEFPKTIAKAIAAIKDVDTIIPGHSPVMKPADLQEYQRFTAELLSMTEAAMKAGKTPDEAAASIDLTGKYPGYKNDRTKAAVAAIYDELKK